MDMAKITKAVSAAKRDLAWLAAIHIALRSRDVEVQKWASALLLHPSNLRVGGNYTETQRAAARERGVAYLKELFTNVDESATDVVGGYLNKVAVVYADAILQRMFLEIYLVIAQKELDARSVGGQINAIAKECGKAEHGASEFGGVPYTRWPQFVAQLRHVIVHKMGKVDQDFRDNMGFSSAKPPKDSPLNLWETRDDEKPAGTWPDEATWDKNYQLGDDVCVDIEKVVTPSLVLCARYAEEVRTHFSEVLPST